jgi:hypothetical protein
MAKKKTAQRAFLLTLRATFDGSQWVCTCLDFGVSSFGSNLKEVEQEVLDMTLDQIQTLEELGDLNDYVARHRVPSLRIDDGHVPSTRRIQVPVESGEEASVFSSVRMLQYAEA